MTRALALFAVLTAVVASSAATAAAPVPHIASMALDGSDVRVLTGDAPANSPTVARDGRILHNRGPDTPYRLWVMNADGSDARPVAPYSEGYGPVSWSPTGTAFATSDWDPSPCLPTSRNCATAEILVRDPATGDVRARLRSRDRGVIRYSWSPDGRRIAALGELDQDLSSYVVEVVNADGTGRRVLVRTRFPNWLSEIAWSPRGDRIAYVQKGWIWFVRPSGGKPQRIVQGRLLSWSPGGRLLYAKDGVRRLLDPATKRSRILFRSSAEVVSWAPDGTRLVYREGYAGGETTLTIRRVSDGRVLRRLKVAGNVTAVSFAPGGDRLVYGVFPS